MRLHPGNHFSSALVLLVACTVSLFAQDDPPQPVTSHWEVGHEITFDLERGRITTPLPFDVPFYLLAPVPESAQDPSACIRHPLDNYCSSDLNADIVRIARQNQGYDTFLEVAVPSLEPQRDYRFHFEFDRERTEEEASKIIELILPHLRTLYLNANRSTVATLAGNTRFRQDLLDAVQRAVQPAKVEVRPGSYIDPGANSFSPVEVGMKFEAPLEQLEIAQGHVQRYIDLRKSLQKPSTLEAGAFLDEIEIELEALNARIAGEDDDTVADDLTYASESLQEARHVLLGFEAQLVETAATIEEWIAEQYDVSASTNANYEARFSWYVSADLGIAVAPEVDEVFSYIGANIYTRPINKKAPLSGFGFNDFRKRFAFMVGLSTEKLTGDERRGLIDDRPLLVGGGLRMTDHLRVTLGAQLFESNDPDPLVTNFDLDATYFGSFSIDFDIAQTFQNLFSPLLSPQK